MEFTVRDGEDDKNPSSYAIVFKGTDNLTNWINNVLAFTKLSSPDMWDAINYSKEFVKEHPSQEITFIGYSKGGSEAIAAAVATNKNAITFNAANFKFYEYDLTEKNKSGIHNYYVEGEFLHLIIGVARFGTTVTPFLPVQFWVCDTTIPDLEKNHMMEAFTKEWGIK